MRRCRVCRAPLSELARDCGACGSAAPIEREEVVETIPRRSSSSAHFHACAEHIHEARVALARVRLRRRQG